MPPGIDDLEGRVKAADLGHRLSFAGYALEKIERAKRGWLPPRQWPADLRSNSLLSP